MAGARKCGNYQAGKLYLEGGGIAYQCDRLPLSFEKCSCCGQVINFSQGIQGPIDYQKLFPYEEHHKWCNDRKNGIDYLCNPHLDHFKELIFFMMYVGSDYTCEEFVEEAQKMGVSKTIPFLPKDFVMGKSVVLLAKKNMVPVERGKMPSGRPLMTDAIFYAFVPKRLVKYVLEDEYSDEMKEDYKKQGITLRKLPNEPKHTKGRHYETKLEKEKEKAAQQSLEEWK